MSCNTIHPGRLACVVLLVAIAWFACYQAWPARHAAAPTMRVAAVQGNIAQSIKWDPQTLPRSVRRYVSLTSVLAPFHPALVIWPETVITTDLNDVPYYWNWGAATAQQSKELRQMLSSDTTLRAQFGALARKLHTTLSVGSLDRHYGPEGLKDITHSTRSHPADR